MLFSRIVCKSKLFSEFVRMQRMNVSYIRSHTFKSNEKKFGVLGWILGTIPVATFCLGTWQVQRRKWKLDLIEQLQNKTNLPPVSLPETLEEISELEFQRVKVRGHFDHSKEMYILPRSLVSAKPEAGGGLISSGKTGSWVVTPFILADRDFSILVNRGWVPKAKTLQTQRAEKLVEEDIDLVGIVRLNEQRVPLASKHLTSDNIRWHRRDVEKMAEVAGCQPIFIDAVAETSQPGGPIGGQTVVKLRNEHLSYIITWYSLSAITAALCYLKFIKKSIK